MHRHCCPSALFVPVDPRHLRATAFAFAQGSIVTFIPDSLYLENNPACSFRAETTSVSLLPHCKTFGGVLRLPSYRVPSPTTSGVYCGLVDGTAQIMHTTVFNFLSPLLATPSIAFTATLGIDAYGARTMGLV